MTNKLSIAAPLLLLEIGTTMATSYQHHSEGRLEISAAYFGTLVGYLLARLLIWLPLGFIFLLVARLCYRPLPIRQVALAALALEVVTTLGSALLSQEVPQFGGIFFASFLAYLGKRMAFWIPLASGSLVALVRLSSPGARVQGD